MHAAAHALPQRSAEFGVHAVEPSRDEACAERVARSDRVDGTRDGERRHVSRLAVGGKGSGAECTALGDDERCAGIDEAPIRRLATGNERELGGVAEDDIGS